MFWLCPSQAERQKAELFLEDDSRSKAEALSLLINWGIRRWISFLCWSIHICLGFLFRVKWPFSFSCWFQGFFSWLTKFFSWHLLRFWSSLAINIFSLISFIESKSSKMSQEYSNSPRHGSFLTRNSSSATQPPPTRTITVLLRMRTRRSFWLSPNWIEKKLFSSSPDEHVTSGYSLCICPRRLGTLWTSADMCTTSPIAWLRRESCRHRSLACALASRVSKLQ